MKSQGHISQHANATKFQELTVSQDTVVYFQVLIVSHNANATKTRKSGCEVKA